MFSVKFPVQIIKERDFQPNKYDSTNFIIFIRVVRDRLYNKRAFNSTGALRNIKTFRKLDKRLLFSLWIDIPTKLLQDTK